MLKENKTSDSFHVYSVNIYMEIIKRHLELRLKFASILTSILEPFSVTDISAVYIEP